jgi:hypothetical protein
LTPVWPDLPVNVRAFTTTRQLGFSSAPYDDGSGQGGFNLATHVGDAPALVQKNRDLLQELLPDPVTFLSQIHGNIIVDVTKAQTDCEADGCFTMERNKICAVMTADCLPVLLSDISGTVVAAVHAGWRGLAAGVVENAVAKLRQAGAQGITAWLGPAISQDAFEVGGDVLRAFTPRLKQAELFFQPTSEKGKYLADIYGIARALLLNVDVHRVHGGEYCTVIDRSLFYSYRRDGVTGRMASLIWMF